MKTTTKVNLKNLTKWEFSQLVAVFEDAKPWLSLASELFTAILAKYEFEYLRWPKKYEFVKQVIEYSGYYNWKTVKPPLLYRNNIEDIIKQVYSDWLNYAKNVKKYNYDSSKYNGKPRPPRRYRNRYPRIQFTSKQLIVDSNKRIVTIKITKDFSLRLNIPPTIDSSQLKSVFIGFNGHNFTAYFTREIETTNLKLDRKKWIAVDPGVRNLFSCVTFDNHAYLFRGARLIQLYETVNNLISKKKSANGNLESKAVKQIRSEYGNKIANEIYRIAHAFVNLLLIKGVGLVILGKNESFKKNSKLGRKNNRIFNRLPIARIYEVIELICKQYGIKVVYQTEEYTSQSDALSDDQLPMRDKNSKPTFKGKRIARGLYSSARRLLVNADINAAINIARKFLGKGAPKFTEMPKKLLIGLLNPVTIPWHEYGKPGCSMVTRPTKYLVENLAFSS